MVDKKASTADDPRDSSEAAQERAKVANKAAGIVPHEDAGLEQLNVARHSGFPNLDTYNEALANAETASDGTVITPASTGPVPIAGASFVAEADAINRGTDTEAAKFFVDKRADDDKAAAERAKADEAAAKAASAAAAEQAKAAPANP